MKRRVGLALFSAAALAGCEKVEMLQVDPRSEHEVAIRIASGRCIDELEIGTPNIKSTVLWQIERDPAAPRACPREVVFPRVPAGFRAIITADRLPAGQYAIFGMAGDHAVAGNFDLRPR